MKYFAVECEFLSSKFLCGSQFLQKFGIKCFPSGYVTYLALIRVLNSVLQ